MKLDQRHMTGSLMVLACAVSYNVWVFTRPATRVLAAPMEAVQDAAALPVMAGDGQRDVQDLAHVPPPPDVAIDRGPVWPRDPFRELAEPPAVLEAIAATPPPSAPAVQADPVVMSILYSAARRLAVVDGRIVRPGERVGDATVVAIEPKAVVLEGADGERRTLLLQSSPGTAVRN
jgi:hypothetical protein